MKVHYSTNTEQLCHLPSCLIMWPPVNRPWDVSDVETLGNEYANVGWLWSMLDDANIGVALLVDWGWGISTSPGAGVATYVVGNGVIVAPRFCPSMEDAVDVLGLGLTGWIVTISKNIQGFSQCLMLSPSYNDVVKYNFTGRSCIQK